MSPSLPRVLPLLGFLGGYLLVMSFNHVTKGRTKIAVAVVTMAIMAVLSMP